MARTQVLTPTENAEIGSPSEDTSNRFQTDKLLRDHAYEIYSRKKGQEPHWKRKTTKLVQPQSLALRIIAMEGGV